jgi:hypothetical protein
MGTVNVVDDYILKHIAIGNKLRQVDRSELFVCNFSNFLLLTNVESSVIEYNPFIKSNEFQTVIYDLAPCFREGIFFFQHKRNTENYKVHSMYLIVPNEFLIKLKNFVRYQSQYIEMDMSIRNADNLTFWEIKLFFT